MNCFKYIFSLFLLCVSVSTCLYAQPTECCSSCDCLTCGEVDNCIALPGSNPALCSANDSVTDVCGIQGGRLITCSSFSENNTNGGICVPIDGGLGFLIAGGLGMGVVATRRREKLELAQA